MGYITADVRELISKLELSGMKVLLFAFGEEIAESPYILHNIPENSVVYTGTHDNNTARGWFEEEATAADRKRLFDYLGGRVTAREVNWALIRMAMMSAARMSVFPMQDLLGLGSEARMNDPSGKHESWRWRLMPGQVGKRLSRNLRDLTVLYGRR